MERSGDRGWRPSGRCWCLRTTVGRSDNPFLVNGDTRTFWVVERPCARIYQGETRGSRAGGFLEPEGGSSGGSRGPRGVRGKSCRWDGRRGRDGRRGQLWPMFEPTPTGPNFNFGQLVLWIMTKYDIPGAGRVILRNVRTKNQNYDLVNFTCELRPIMTRYDFLEARRMILSNVRSDSKLTLVNISCEWGQIMTRYYFVVARRVVLSNIRSKSNLTYQPDLN